MSQDEIQYLQREGGKKLAYIYSPASDAGKDMPTLVFCGGFKSDMMGTKATYFEAQCRARGQAYVRFDYSGHGLSGGEFKEGTIGAWCEDALAIFDTVTKGPVIIAGSSMGGWIALLMAQARADRVKGLIGIAAAPDFTERLYDDEFDDAQREAVETQGYVEEPNDYSDEPYIFTKALFEDGKQNLVLTCDHTHDYPITLFHGLQDHVVPKESPLAIRDRYGRGALDIVFIEDGDHSLSRPQDLEMIEAEIAAMSRVGAL
jgi:pimeloyl-ACP methyl ester carboxylesterase